MSRTSGIRRRERAHGVVYEVRFRDLNGRLRGRIFPREADARRFRSEVAGQVFTGAYVPPEAGQVRFATVAEDWHRATAHLKARTRLNYQTILDTWLARFGDVGVGRIRHLDAQDLIAEMIGVGRQATTVRNVALVMRSVMEEAVRQGLLASNPCRQLSLPRVERTEQHFLTVGQVIRLVPELPAPFNLLVRMAAARNEPLSTQLADLTPAGFRELPLQVSAPSASKKSPLPETRPSKR